MILSNKQITEALIRLHECAGWSASLLFANSEDRFSWVEDHLCKYSYFVQGGEKPYGSLSFRIFHLITFKNNSFKQSGNSVDPDQRASQKPADLDLHCFQNGITSDLREHSGRVLDSKSKGRGFEPHRGHCIVVLEQDTFILA